MSHSNFKSESEEFWRKFSAELEVSGSDESGLRHVLEEIRQSPAAMSRAVPPAGYESELLGKLRDKLPATPSSRSEISERVRGLRRRAMDHVPFFLRPSFSWGASSAFALLAVIGSITYIRMSRDHDRAQVAALDAASGDLLSQTAAKGANRVVASWVESVGDGGTQMRVAQNDFVVLSGDLRNSRDVRALDRALEEMERSLKP